MVNDKIVIKNIDINMNIIKYVRSCIFYDFLFVLYLFIGAI